MRFVMMFLVIFMSAVAVPGSAFAFTRTAVPYDGGAMPYSLSADCTLSSANACAGWIWAFNDVEGAIWGTVFDPADCGPWGSGIEAVVEILLYSRCSTTPGMINNVAISSVDALRCRTSLRYQSGPITVTHCVSGDRWTLILPGCAQVGLNPFAVTVTWGPQSAGVNNPQFATDNGIANLYCSQGVLGTFPGCATTTPTCPGWTIPAQNTFIYITDFNGDGLLDDLCALYGGPYPLSFPYFYPYGYLPNNLMLSVGVDRYGASAVEPSSWGHVKSLFE